MKQILSITIILTILFSNSIYTQSWNGVFVGINLYSGDYNKLEYCVKDANDIYAVLSMCRWNENNMIPILDRQATGSYIRSKIAAMPTTQGNTNLFYFAGHGDSQTLPGIGPHYDGIIATDGVIYSPRDLQYDLHNYNQSAVFIDACGSGIFPNNMTCGVVASACMDNEVAKEGPGYSDGVDNGFYTYYLKQYLSYSVSTADEVAEQARDATKNRWGQSPQVKDNFVGYLSLYNAPNTSSGQITRNETWSVPSILTGDTYIGSTGSITFCPGSMLDLREYAFLFENGRMYFQGGTLGLTSCITGQIADLEKPDPTTGNSSIIGYSGSIESALSWAHIGETVNVLETGNYTINKTVTVKSGVTLSIPDGTTLTFANGAQLIVEGLLNLKGSCTFDFGSPNATTQNGIIFNSNSTQSIQNAIIRNAYCGIYANGSNVGIVNNNINNNTIGIRLYSSGSSITGNTIHDNTYYGIQADNSSIYLANQSYNNNNIYGNGYGMVLNNAAAYIYNNKITDNQHGMVITSSNPQFCTKTEGRGYNMITCSTTPLFKVENSTNVYLGYAGAGGYNSIFGSALPDIEAYNHSTVYADYNYWGGSSPASLTDDYSYIYANNPLSTDPNPGSSCTSAFNIELAKNNILSVSVQNDETSNKYLQAISLGNKKDYQNANKLLHSILSGEYNQKYSPLALNTYYEFSNHQNANKNLLAHSDSLNVNNYELRDFLISIGTRPEEDSLRPFAFRLLARDAAISKDYESMKLYNQEIIDKYPNSENELTALYDLITYYIEIEKNYGKAKKYLERLENCYPNNDLTKFAEMSLKGKVDLQQENMKKVNKTNISEPIYENSLSNAYPNPFNPSTTITYNLAKRDHVTLIVYDVLGKEVSRLVDEIQNEGAHTINFNANDLPSGVYIYQLKGTNFQITKKLLFAK